MTAARAASNPMFEPAVEALPWEEQIQRDDALYRDQIARLFTHSPFYRKKLTEAGFDGPAAAGGLDSIGALPFTEKDELRATRSEAEPIGTHLAVPMAELARIYSTSGTTGAPSYVPLTADDLADWATISARSYAASGVGHGDRLIATYNVGPFVAGATIDAFAKLGLTIIPVGSGNTDRLMAAVQLLKADAIALTPSYALHLAEWALEHGINPAETSVRRLLVAGEPGGGEPAMRARLEGAWDAEVTEAMGIGDIAVSLWGECHHRQGMHFSGRGFVHFELIDPETGAPVPLIDGAEGELVYTHLRHRAAPLLALPQPRSRPRLGEPLPLRPHRAARALHRPHRRHADRARRQRLSVGGPRGGQRIRARGQRRALHPPARQRLPPGSAAESHGRTRRGRVRQGPRRDHPRAHPREADLHRGGGAGALRQPAALELQVALDRLERGKARKAMRRLPAPHCSSRSDEPDHTFTKA